MLSMHFDATFLSIIECLTGACNLSCNMIARDLLNCLECVRTIRLHLGHQGW